MQINQILTSDLLDIIFEGRNKEYGAYMLRKTYSRRINKALMTTSLIILAAISGILLASKTKNTNISYRMGSEVTISDLNNKEPEKIIEPEKPKQPEAPQQREIAYTDFKLVNKDILNNPPPTMDEVGKGSISDKNVDGVDPTDVPIKNESANIGEGKGVIDEPVTKEPDKFIPVEVPAKFSGSWTQFLEKNLNPEIPVSNNASAGRYTVVIRFMIDENGNIISTEALSNQGFGMEQEAIRVIKKASSKWEAPVQNGVKLRAVMTQKITFVVPDEG